MNPLVLIALLAGGAYLYYESQKSNFSSQAYYSSLSIAAQGRIRAALWAWFATNPHACAAVDTSGWTSADALKNEGIFASAVDCYQTATGAGAVAGVFDASMYKALLPNG